MGARGNAQSRRNLPVLVAQRAVQKPLMSVARRGEFRPGLRVVLLADEG